MKINNFARFNSKYDARSYEQCVEMCERIAGEYDWQGKHNQALDWKLKANNYKKHLPDMAFSRVMDSVMEIEYDKVFGRHHPENVHPCYRGRVDAEKVG